MKPVYLWGGAASGGRISVRYRAGETVGTAWETGRVYDDWKWRWRFAKLDKTDQNACEKFIGMRLLSLERA